MPARKITIHSIVFLFFLSILGIALGATRPASETEAEAAAEEREYKQERDRIESTRRLFKPGGDNDLGEYENFAEEIQSKWRHRKKEHYARLMLEICGPLSSGDFKDRWGRNVAHNVARQYALSALEKPDAIPLTLEMELTGHVMTDMHSRLAPTGDEFARRRTKDVEIRLHAWKRLLDAIDPEWDPDVEDLTLYVEPPLGVGPDEGFIWGMDPAGIKDPVQRAAYETAIKDNREKNEKWEVQYRLRDWLKRYPKDAERYTIDAYSRPPFDLNELEQYLTKYIADEKTRARIVNAVTKNMKKKQNE